MVAPWVMHLGRTPDGANGGFWVPLTLMALMGGGMALPVGGSEMLAKALVKLIEDRAAWCAPTRPWIASWSATARRWASARRTGDEIAARTVVASVNPDQMYLELLADADVPAPLVKRASQYRYGRGCVQVQLALGEAPHFADERLARTGQPHLARSWRIRRCT